MILEIAISNFRSIDKDQVLSFYSLGDRGGNLGNTAILPGSAYRALKSIGLYGANGSGKTNALRAIWAVRMLIGHSYRLGEGERIPWYEPCIFHDKSLGSGCRFEVEFSMPIEQVETRFLYKVEFDEKEIIFESLSSFARGREAVLFTRKQGDDRNSMAFGASLRGGERKIAFFANQAYLSVAGRNPAAPAVIRAIYRYFKQGITQIRLHEVVNSHYSDSLTEAQGLVRYADLGIADMVVRDVQVDEAGLNFPKGMPEHIRQQILDDVRKRYYFVHRLVDGTTGEIELHEESDGTQRLFQLLPQLVNVIVNGGVYIIDEIESGMHPFMAEIIVKLFNDPELNAGQAQLLFSTHDNTLLSPNLMRRDQIWFAEKIDGRSRFFSLDDFDKKTVTPTSPFARWYLEGRFGAVPNINYAGLVDAIKAIRSREASNA